VNPILQFMRDPKQIHHGGELKSTGIQIIALETFDTAEGVRWVYNGKMTMQDMIMDSRCRRAPKGITSGRVIR
jgi:hypothetical protein